MWFRSLVSVTKKPRTCWTVASSTPALRNSAKIAFKKICSCNEAFLSRKTKQTKIHSWSSEPMKHQEEVWKGNCLGATYLNTGGQFMSQLSNVSQPATPASQFLFVRTSGVKETQKQRKCFYLIALTYGDENISSMASVTWTILTISGVLFCLANSQISVALLQISRHRRASPDSAATCKGTWQICNNISYQSGKEFSKNQQPNKTQTPWAPSGRATHLWTSLLQSLILNNQYYWPKPTEATLSLTPPILIWSSQIQELFSITTEVRG